MRHVTQWPTLVILFAMAASARAEDSAASIGDAFRDGRPTLSVRYRFEHVSDDAIRDKDAHASTLRSVLGFDTAAWKGWSLSLEAENVSVVGTDLYNNAGAGAANNGIRDRPVVADAAGSGVNQALLRYSSDGLRIQVGRQEIVLGDSRFVGNVGWRQNHQSFDALRVSKTGIGPLDFEFDYAFVDNASRIDGGNHEMSSHLLQGKVSFAAENRLTLYGFLLDYDNPAQYTLSTSTLGAEWAGASDRGGWKLLWEAEYAGQRDAGDNPRSVDADYTHLMAGAALARLTVKLGYEVLGGSSADGQFKTPLATLHKFNGWADRFLSTPANGLEDLSLALSGKLGPTAWTAVFHDFSAATGSADYGEEIDLQLIYTAPWKQGFGLKGAVYDAASFAVDTSKWMIWTTYSI